MFANSVLYWSVELFQWAAKHSVYALLATMVPKTTGKNTIKPLYNEPQYSEFCSIVN